MKPDNEIGVYLTDEELEAFEEIRWREHKKKTEIGRDAVLEYIKNHGDGNDTYPLEKWQEDPNFQAVPAYYRDKDTWINHYKEANDKEKTRMRIRAMDFTKWFRMVDVNTD